MFNGGEFSKILDEIFEKDDKEKEKAIKIYCKIWEYLENITLQNLKYKRAFEILKPSINEIYQIWDEDIYGVEIDECDFRFSKEDKELLEELMNCGTKDN